MRPMELIGLIGLMRLIGLIGPIQRVALLWDEYAKP